MPRDARVQLGISGGAMAGVAFVLANVSAGPGWGVPFNEGAVARLATLGVIALVAFYLIARALKNEEE